jgi:hypothetical protein
MTAANQQDKFEDWCVYHRHVTYMPESMHDTFGGVKGRPRKRRHKELGKFTSAVSHSNKLDLGSLAIQFLAKVHRVKT